MFQLEASETLSAGLRRLLIQQIELARDQIEADHQPSLRVHEARKAFKRSRALIRLVREELGPESYTELNRTFRDAGRRLAARRTRWVLRELAARFRREAADPIVSGAFGSLEASLDDGPHAGQEGLDDHGRLAAALGGARDRIDGWATVRDDFDLVRPGLRRVYRTGRRRMRAAWRDPGCERFHEWRKVVKYLWHQVEVLRPSNPTILEPLAETIHALADLLGDEHDLCDLLEVARRQGAFESDVALEAAERHLIEERTRLRSAAWPIAEAVYGEKSVEFARRLAGYWSDWRAVATPRGIAGYGT